MTGRKRRKMKEQTSENSSEERKEESMIKRRKERGRVGSGEEREGWRYGRESGGAG